VVKDRNLGQGALRALLVGGETVTRSEIPPRDHQMYLETSQLDLNPKIFVNSLSPALCLVLVWDASRNGINLRLRAPPFWMPTFRTLQDLIIKWLPCSISDYFARNLPHNPAPSNWRIPHQSDMDVGEMFLNYMLYRPPSLLQILL
jgi:hypothetical protein